MTRLTITPRSALPLTAGLAAAQLIGTFFVRRSNLELRQSVAAMQSAGWLPFPAGPAAQTLDNLGAALGGGLFYTLTIGAGLSLATWALLCLGRRLPTLRPWFLWAGAGLWLVLIVGVNLRGGVLFPTLFAVGVPLATLLGGLRKAGEPSAAEEPAGRGTRLWFMPLVMLALLTGLWSTQLNEQLFTAIRDQLLLSNAAGRAVNDFYYRYTLHAAQAFKSFGQKSVRTWRLEGAAEGQIPPGWIRVLAGLDLLAAPEDPHADLVVAAKGERLTLTARLGDRIEVEREAFSREPASWIKRFSEAGDRYAPFRRLIFAGLLVGFPVLLFVMVDGGIGRAAGRFVKNPAALMGVRCGVCLVLGVGLLLPLLTSVPEISRAALVQSLNAPGWPQRVAALRLIEREKLDIAAFPQYHRLLDSPQVVERYYLARALAFSRSPETLADLLRLIKDAHPNVVCQAYFALGRRGQREAAESILTQMVQSDHWYTQWYGYNAIRSLGWRQSR